jgi:hypothetical protein
MRNNQKGSSFVDQRLAQVKELLEARKKLASTKKVEGKGLALVNDEPLTIIVRGTGDGNIIPEECEGIPAEYWPPLRDALKKYFDVCSELLAPEGKLPI